MSKVGRCFELVSRNVLPARLFGFVVAPPGDIQTLLQVEPDGAPGRFRYYDGMWYMMALLHLSGEYRVWTPRGRAKP